MDKSERMDNEVLIHLQRIAMSCKLEIVQYQALSINEIEALWQCILNFLHSKIFMKIDPGARHR